MKKFLQTVLFSCLFVSATFAQMRATMGVRAGVNVASYKFSMDQSPTTGVESSFKNLPLLTVSLPFEFIFSPHFALQTELNFIQKGFSSKFSLNTQGIILNAEGKIIVNWLEIPILAKAKFGSTEGVSGGLFLGPSIGYGISGKSTSISTDNINGSLTTTSDSRNLDFKKDEHSRIDVGLNFGGDISYGGFFLDARYQLGFTNMISDTNTTTGTKETAKTRGIAITLGYRFPLGL
jgi:Outer membrane protein beta-barrel domain